MPPTTRRAARPLSAGILVFRGSDQHRSGGLEVLIGHMGGPFWAVQDDGAWSVPKGLVEEGELPLDAARREFTEETGLAVPAGSLLDLGTVHQSSRKDVQVWALEGDVDLAGFDPGTFSMEWPPKTGRMIDVAELDAIRWQSLDDARTRLVPGQHPFLDRLADLVG